MICVTTSYGKVKGKAKNYPYFQPATYERKVLKNGRVVWYYIGHEGRARRSVGLAEKDARQLAASQGYLFISSVRHLTECFEVERGVENV